MGKKEDIPIEIYNRSLNIKVIKWSDNVKD